MPVEDDDTPHIEELAPATGAEIESWHAPEFWGADPLGRQEKAFDPHESRDQGGKWSKTGGAAGGKAKPTKPIKLTDEQRDLLRSLHEHFPDGIGHLLDATGRVDRAHVFPDEEKYKAKIEEHKQRWRTTDGKIEALLEQDKPALQRVADDEAFNTRIVEQLPSADSAFDLNDYEDEDKEVHDALAEVIESLDTLESGDAPPEDDDYIDHDEYTLNEDDVMPEDDDDPDTLEDRASSADDAATEHAERLAELQKLVTAHAKTVSEASEKWHAGIKKQLKDVLDATEKALKFGPERFVENPQYGSGGKVIGAIHDHDTLQDIQKNVKKLLKECSESSSA